MGSRGTHSALDYPFTKPGAGPGRSPWEDRSGAHMAAETHRKPKNVPTVGHPGSFVQQVKLDTSWHRVGVAGWPRGVTLGILGEATACQGSGAMGAHGKARGPVALLPRAALLDTVSFDGLRQFF